MGVGGIESPSGIIVNPASTAFAQRLKIDLSFGFAPAFFVGSLQNTGESFQNVGDFFSPFIINGGVLIPSRYGNFTIYANYSNTSNLAFEDTFHMGLNNNDLNFGKTGAIYFGFAKDYDDNFAFGVTGNVKFSYNPESRYEASKFDVGGGFDFGFIFRPDWYVPFSKTKKTAWGLQDFEFALTLKDVGKPLINTVGPDFAGDYAGSENDFYWFPAMVTPAAGLSFNLVNTGTTYWKMLADISVPFFQNLTVAAGTEVQIFNFLVLRAAYTFDLEGVLEYAGVIPQYEYMYSLANVNFGMSFRFRSDIGKRYASKEEEYKNRNKITTFSIDLGARPYYSGFIFEAGMTITIGVKDTTPPEINYIQRNLYVSPNNDGIKDDVVIDLDIKDDRYITMWKLEIYDADKNIVRTIKNKEQRKESMKFQDVVKKYFSPKQGVPIPKQIVWDGMDDSGNVVKDGTYTYKFFAMDDNKNINPEGSNLGTIVVKTDPPLIEENIPYKIFSPNSAGSKSKLTIDLDIVKSRIDEIEILPEVEEIEPVLESKSIKEMSYSTPVMQQVSNSLIDKDDKQIWYVDVLTNNDKIVKTYQFLEKGKQKIEWDGKDDKGNLMPDGVYKIRLRSTDTAGNSFEKMVTNIIIDTEPRPIEVTNLASTFSPNGDGVKDTIGFRTNVGIKTGIEKWTYEILSKDDKVVRTTTGAGVPPDNLSWDGKDDSGTVTPEGDYRGKLALLYQNGSAPSTTTPVFKLDLTPPSATLALSTKIFSPIGAGKLSELNITVSNPTEEEEWTGSIFDASGKKVKTYIWKGTPPKQFTWDGKDNNNKLLPDAEYYFQIESTDLAGNSFTSPRNGVKIFTGDIPVFVTADYDAFSYAGNSPRNKQIFEIKSSLPKDQKVLSYEFVVLDDKDKVVYTLKGQGNPPSSVEWNGVMDNKEKAPEGFYSARLKVAFETTDSVSTTKQFEIDNTPPTVDVTSVSSVFSPDGDGFLDTFEVLQKGSKENEWQEKITDKDNKVLWESFYNGEPKQKEVWDGKDQGGNIQKNGMYKYTISSTDKAGNNVTKTLDIELKVMQTRAVLTLDTDKFSPKNNAKIKVEPTLSVKDDIEIYKLEIMNNDTNKVVKTIENTKKSPESLEWDGLGDNGKIVDDGIYSAKLSLIYRFGNRPSVTSSTFIVDTTPPDIKVTTSPEYFSPDNDGNDDELFITTKSYDLSGIKEWKLTIMTPDNKKPFKVFSGTGKPTEKIVWNGKSDKGELVESAETYPFNLYAIDTVGNAITKELEPILVDILVELLPDGRLKIKISNIEFKPESAEMTTSPKNDQILKLLTKALKKYTQHKILVEGHANKYKEGLDEVRAKQLSDQRAKYIMGILSKSGISKQRLTAEGKGFDVPLVPLTPDATSEDLGKNRRVEFYLDDRR